MLFHTWENAMAAASPVGVPSPSHYRPLPGFLMQPRSGSPIFTLALHFFSHSGFSHRNLMHSGSFKNLPQPPTICHLPPPKHELPMWVAHPRLPPAGLRIVYLCPDTLSSPFIAKIPRLTKSQLRWPCPQEPSLTLKHALSYLSFPQNRA